MALWLIRSGAEGEFEQRFLDEGRIYFNWTGLNLDLSKLSELADFYQVFDATYSDINEGARHNWARQGSQFAKRMEKGDWVAMPGKFNPVIHFGDFTGPYVFDRSGEERFKQFRPMDWFALDIPRDRFDQDILYSLGAFLTVAKSSGTMRRRGSKRWPRTNGTCQSTARMASNEAETATDEV